VTLTASVSEPAAAPIASEVGRSLARRDALSVAPGIVPFGTVLGVTIAVVGADRLAGLVGAVAVYAGSAQLSAVSLLDKGLGVLAAVLTAAVVNVRLLLYSAALGERFRRQRGLFRWLAPHFIIDQTYLMASAREDLDDDTFRTYWLWLGGTILVVWTSSIALGVLLGPALPDLPHLSLVGTTLFVGMLAPRLVTRPAVVAAAAAGLTAGLVSQVAPALGIVAGAVAGVLAALSFGGSGE
jgi:predicted branched-subunit amino acid permease